MFIVEKKPESINAESYRILRTNIQYSSFNKEVKSILITSTECGEGKTTVCGNMALAFSQDNKKVLLIDGDFRKPSIHNMFNISNENGLAEVLTGNKKFEEVIYAYNDNLDILTSGNIPINPSEMLGSTNMDILLEEVKKIYDYIILDSAPINLVSDSQLLSTKADGTILVIKKNKTKIKDVKEVKELLEKIGCEIIGCVFNYNEKIKKKYRKYYTKKNLSNTYKRCINRLVIQKH